MPGVEGGPRYTEFLDRGRVDSHADDAGAAIERPRCRSCRTVADLDQRRIATISRDRQGDRLTRCMLAGVGQSLLNQPIRRSSAHRRQARQLHKGTLHSDLRACVAGFLDQPWQVRRAVGWGQS